MKKKYLKKILLIGLQLIFSSVILFAQAPSNDNCNNAIPLTVGTTCNYVQYTNANATNSNGVPAPGCASYSGGDVWFSAVVPASGSLIINTNTGVVTDGGMALYTGNNCNNLSLVVCDDDGSPNGLMPLISQTGLTPGATVYIRFWEYGNNNNGTFSICAMEGVNCGTSNTSNSTCASANPFCTGVSYDYCNTTNVPSLGGGGIYGCCLSTPNPAFYFLNVATTGPITFNISQQTFAGVGIDVDYVVWGPFSNQSDMCNGLTANNIVSCSYSTAAIETATIPNAQAGEWYMVLITNFANQPGVINFSQTNTSTTGSGTTNCNLVTAAPSACNGGNYTLNGTVSVPSPPATGTLTVTNSCGGSQVFNPPFSNTINFSIPNICGNGANCTVSANFSEPGAPIVVPTTYTAPSCNTLTATPGACSGNTYVMSGTLTTGCLPTTGTLTISSSCGGSVTYNAPFTSPLNWSLPASSGNGGNCTITAVYSASGAPIITPVVVTEPTCCSANAGTINVSVTNGIQTTSANGNIQIALCSGGSFSMTTNNDYTLPPAGCVTCTPGLMYAIYNANGPTGPDPDLDPNWTAYYWTGANFPGTSTAGYNTNTGGACSPLLNLSSVTGFASTHSPTNTLVFIPITGDAINLPNHDNNNDYCFDIGNSISVTYLNPITFNVVGSCSGSLTVEINGGAPQFLGGLYTITNMGAGTPGSTYVSSGGNVTFTGLTSGQIVSFTVNDGTGCPAAFTQIYTAVPSPVVSVTPSSSVICSGACVNLNATVTSSTPAGTTTFSNTNCYAIPDGGIASTNTGQVNTGSWANSPINVTGFCGTNWTIGQTLTVCLNINHTYDADLNIFLQSPNGTIFSLSQDHGGANDGYINTCFTATATNIIGSGGNNNPSNGGTFAPDGTGGFGVFNGTPINGVWQLWVGDDVAVDAGYLSNWSITFQNQNSYTYSWAPTSGLSVTNTLNPTACPTSSTDYILTVTNSCGCSTSDTASITVTTGIEPIFNAVNPICSGASLSALPTTSTNGITGTWSPATMNNTATTTYVFTPTAGQCADTASMTIVVYEQPSIYPHGTNPTCANLCNGSATVDVVGGTAPYTYSWSNGATTQTISNLCVGTYTITVTDANGCVSSAFNPVTNGCAQIQSILVNSCAANEWDEEMVFFQVGQTALNTSAFTVTWPTTADTWHGLCANPAYISAANATITGGGILLPLPSNGIIPANANVVLISNVTLTTPVANFANLQDTVYAIFQCSGNTNGHFSNSAASPNALVLNFGAGCVDSVRYSGSSLSGGDGAYVNYSTGGTPTYLNYGCTIPYNIQGSQVVLTAPPIYTTNTTASTCQGTPYTLPWGGTASTAGTYTHVYTAANGCDSTVNLTLSIKPTYTTNTTASTCQGTSYSLPWGGTASTAGTYTHVYTAANGCDSTVNLTLSIKPTYTINTTASTCQGTSYSLPWGGTASTAGTYTHVYTAANGCDSTVNLTLSIKPTYTTNTTASTCQGTPYSLPWGGSASTTGIYTHTYATASGCDSVVNIALTVNPTYTTNTTASTCQGTAYSLPWGGTASTAGTYTHVYTAANGCDSTVNLTLSIKPTYTTNTTASTCQGTPYSLPWGGTASTAGTYTHVYTAANGCDSTVNLTLSIKPTYTTNTTASTCQGTPYSLPWGGTASTAGTYTHVYTAANGCDSTVNLTLSIKPTYTTNTTASACQGTPYSLPWGGTASTAGTYTHVYTAANGCDSTVNLTLSIKPTYTTNTTASTCQGTPYSLPWGGTASTAGTYTHVYTAANGCDSTVNLTLSIKPTYTTNTTASTCQGTPYSLPWGGTASTAGTYTHVYIAANGCDSTVNLTLSINSTFVTNNTATICQGQSYSLPWGGTASTTGTYTHTYSTSSGCDSIVNIVLTVNPTYTTNTTVSTCQGTPYSLPWGGTASTAGTYTHVYTAANGCDSTVNLTLSIKPTYTTNTTASTCQGTPYSLPWGGTASTAGTYTHVYTAANGCDSTVNLTLSIKPTYTTNTTASTCQGTPYSLPWGGTASTAGTYTHVYTAANGCDSTVNLTLSIKPTYTTNTTASTCQGTPYSLPWGGTASTAGTYTHVYTAANGCDSTVNLTLSIKPTYTTNTAASTCQGTPYSLPWGGTATTAGTYTHVYTAANGCDSTVNLTLSINSTFVTNSTATICQGQSYSLPWGGTSATTGTYTHTYSTSSGCDSVVNIALTVNPIYTTNTTASTCQGTPYSLPWGGTASTAGTYTHVYTAANGCDSTVNLTLSINSTFVTNNVATICQGQSYSLPWGGSASTTGTYTHTYSTASGCDSIVNIALTVNPTYTTNTTASTCQGNSYSLPWGGTASTAGTYTHIYTAANGCDSTVNLTLSIKPTYTTNTTASTCQGTPYSLPWGGTTSTAGTYTHVYTAANGCDSSVNLTLSINSTFVTNNVATICQGQSYSLPWGGTAVTTGTYTHTYSTSSGCDSIVNIALTVNPTYTTNTTGSTCQGTPYSLPWGGIASTAGTYTHVYTAANGCDSTVNLTLSINSTYITNNTATICQGQSYSFPWGGTASTTGTYTHTYSTASGCDSVVNIALTVNPISTSTTNITICNNALPYVWNGQSYNTAGTYNVTFTNSNGCDSIATLNLTVNNTTTSATNITICNNALPYVWNGQSYSTGGSYNVTLTNSNGCDSIATLNLTVNNTTTSITNITICNNALPYVWNGQLYNTTGTYNVTLTNSNGCDSIATLNLTVNNASASTTNITICNNALPYVWNGQSYNTAGTYNVTLTNANNCDSIATLILTVNNATTSITNITICNNALPYVWNGQSYNTAGSYNVTLTNANNCDSIATLNLTINNATTSTTNLGLCPSQLPYSWNGQTINAGGTYTATLTGSNGCDSVATLIVSISAISTSNTNITICNTQLPYSWNGQTLNTSGTYIYTTTAQSGCDSIATLNLTVNNATASTTNLGLCPSQLPYSWNGQTINAGGTYTATLTGSNGCDSVATLFVTISAISTSTTSITVCNTQLPYTWNGQTFNASGTYTFTTTAQSGCDSIATLNLIVNNATTSTTNITICNNALPYVWNGQSYNTAGTYNVTLTNANNCDSIATLILTVNNATTSTTNLGLCPSQLPYSWNGQTINAGGTYTATLTGSNGCDSIATLVVTISAISTSTTNITICNNALPYVWNGQTYNTAGTYNVTLTNANNCDSIATLILTVNNATTSTTNLGLCPSQLPYTWNGQTINAGGTFTATLIGSNGCDSIATLVVTISAISTSNTNITICNTQLPYSWNGQTLNATGTYTYTTTAQSGCDSIATLNLIVNNETTSTTNLGLCPSQLPYSWNGQTINAGGTYTATLTGSNGCDSVATLVVIISVISTSNTNIPVCNTQLPYSWNGQTLNATGTYTYTTTAQSGCDSIATLILTVNNATTSTTNLGLCPSQLPYSWNGQTINAGGTYTATLTGSNGCDSIATLVVTISAISTSTTNITICNTQLPYSWNGQTLNTSGTYIYTTTAQSGCDSIATLNLTVNNATASTTNLGLCPSQLPYTWNGQTINAGGTFTATLIGSNGCDSIATLVVTISAISTSNTNITICNTQLPYTWNGQTLNATGTYTYTTTAQSGCDSIATLNLIVNNETTSTTNLGLCPSQLPYSWNGQTINAGGTYTATLTGSNGCDSVATLVVTISAISTSTTNITVCNTQLPYSWNGQTLNTSGTYIYTTTAQSGCDSIATLNLTVNNATASTTNLGLCPSQLPYTWNGQTINAGGTFTATLIGSNGCDSIATLVVTISAISTSNTNITICNTQLPYTWNGQTLNATGTYTYTTTAQSGCDSIATLNLIVNNETTSTTNLGLCPSQLPYSWNGQTINAGGTYTATLTGSNGCDSVATLVVTISAISTSTTNITVCNTQLPYSWNGQTLNTSGTYTFTTTAQSGCDSIATLNLTVNNATTSTTNITICNNALPYVWNGQSFNTAGSYNVTLTNANNCDSIATLILTVNNATTSTTNVTICNNSLPYIWNGQSYNTAGTYNVTLTNANNCDSIATLNLTVNNTTTSATNITICNNALPYVWNGQSYNTSGTYNVTLTNSNGCDSIATLNLTVNNATASTTNLGLCPSQLPYSWNGQTINAGGTYTATLTGSNGCDSVATLVVTISAISTSTTNITVCNTQLPYSWNGQTLNTSGTYSYTTTAQSGCDSIATLNLTINNATTSTTNITICNNALPYSWNGQTINTGGTYTATLTGSNGCDSVATLVVTISAISTSTTNITVCNTQLPYSWNGQTFNTSGTYTFTTTAQSGCDSIATLNLIVNNATSSTTNITICNNALPYVWNGQSFSTGGSYNVTLTNSNGCDSIATMNLTINTITQTTFNAAICQGNSYSFPWGGSSSVAGTFNHTYFGTNGCDSIVSIILTVNPVFTQNINASFCQGSSYTLPWGTSVSNPGLYAHTYTSVLGCDSIINLTLIANPVYNLNVQAFTCQGSPYNLPWGGTAVNAGTYTHTYLSALGCDSIVNIILSIRNRTTSTTNLSICSSQLPYNWNGQTLNSGGTYTATLTGSNGCDSNAILQLTVNATPSAPQVQPVQDFCQGSIPSPLSANGSFPLTWYPTATGGTGTSVEPTPSTSVPGYYHYYVSQTNGNCESPRAHILVRINRKPAIGSDREVKICYGKNISLTNIYNTTGMTSVWTFNGTSVLNPSSVNASGNYQLIVNNTSGCKDTAVVHVIVQPQVVANAGPDDNAVFNEPYQLHGSGGLYYSWMPSTVLNNPSIANPRAILTDETQFVLTVKDEIGCSDTDTVLIKVFRGPTFYIPNAFTPNGDGLNDDFKPTYVGIQKLDYFRIYDRYGLLVFETYDMGKAWDGKYKGVKQPMSNYVYIVKGTDKNGKEKILKGNVLLIH